MDSLNEQFGRIYDQYIDKIYRFIYFKVNSQEIAEDITSKVFLKGFEAFKNQQAGSSSVIKNQGAFLYQIARNAVIDYYREKGRSKSMSIDDAPQIADPGTSAHDKAVLNADVEAVKNAIKKLKKDYQDIIIWYYLEDMPVEEISRLLDKPAGTIRVMLHRGLKDLRDIIQKA